MIWLMPKNLRKDHAPPKKVKMKVFHQNLRNDHAPQKFDKRPCSIKKFEKRPCSIKKFEKRPCSIEKRIWPCSIKMWQMASKSGGTWSFLKFWRDTFLDPLVRNQELSQKITLFHQNLKNDHVPPKFEKWPCSIKKWKWSCSTKMWQMTSNFGGTLDFWACLSAIKSFLKKWPCSTKIWETTMLHQKN